MSYVYALIVANLAVCVVFGYAIFKLKSSPLYPKTRWETNFTPKLAAVVWLVTFGITAGVLA